MSEVSSTLLKVQLSEFIPEPEPVVPDTDGNTPGTSNTGFHTTIQSEADSSAAETTSHAVPIAFFGLAFFILTFIIITLIKKRKNPYAIEGRSTRLTKLQVLSAATASVFLAVVFNSAIFSTPYIGPVDTEVSEELTIKADILGTDDSAYVKDTIVLPASEYGYDLYISTDDTNDNRLIADSTEGVINSIAAEGALENDTYGFSFVDPAVDNTKFQPIQLKDSGKTSVLSLSPEQTATEQHIDIWYGVRSKELEEDVYRTNIEYLTIGRQALPLEEMTPEICASLETGVIDYEFTNSLGETQYVSKLADGNCWTRPVPTEDPSEPSPVLACPTNWHEAKQNDYSELDIFYHVKDPATTADPIIVEYDQTAEHPEGGCIADFFETTATFEHNDGPDSIGMPDPITVDATDFESTITMPDLPSDSPLKSHFRGWSLTPDGSAPLYQPEDDVTFTSPSVTLYAIWDERTPKAILDENGLLNFVYDYHSVDDVINDVDGYRTAYEATHAPIKTEGVNCTTACVYLVPENADASYSYKMAPWTGFNYDNTQVVSANFENSFIEFKPKSTSGWFYHLTKLEDISNLENLNTADDVNMHRMFINAFSLTSLEFPAGFGSAAVNMNGMFQNTRSLESIHLPDGFGRQATNMSYMFATVWTAVLTDVNFPAGFGSKAVDMSHMFDGNSKLGEIELPAGFGSVATNMDSMFLGAGQITHEFPAGFGSEATNMKRMFSNKIWSFNSNIFPAGFGSKTTNMSDMFSLESSDNASSSVCQIRANHGAFYIDGELEFPDGFGGVATNMMGMFRGRKMHKVVFPDGFGSQATNMAQMFENWRGSTVYPFPAGTVFPDGFGSVATNMNGMFMGSSFPSGFVFPTNFGTQANNMGCMFNDSSSQDILDLPAGFGSLATNTEYMFAENPSKIYSTLPAGFGSVATNMGYMFSGNLSDSLEFPAGFGSVATDMSGMFKNTNNLTSLSFPAGFGSVATKMNDMFGYWSIQSGVVTCNTNVHLHSITFPDGFGANVTSSYRMFTCATSLTTLSFPAGFGNALNVTYEMFENASGLEHIYISPDTDWSGVNVNRSSKMFTGAVSLPNYSDQNANDITNAHINGQGSTTGYFTDVCELYGTCATNSGAASPNSLTGPEGTQQSPQSVSPNSETPSNISPLGAKATKIDNSLAILFAIAMACLFAGTTMLILIIEKVKRDYREEDDQF